MSGPSGRLPRVRPVLGVALAGLVLTGCTAGAPGTASPVPDPPVAPGALRLVSYDSCDDALRRLRAATRENVQAHGLGYGIPFAAAAEPQAGAERAGGDTPTGTAHSGTNTHEAGADEPDIVKTDGRRIVTVADGVLTVVDPARRVVTGTLRLHDRDNEAVRWATTSLLLHGDRVLVLVDGVFVGGWGGLPGEPREPMPPRGEPVGPTLVLVDLSEPPRLISRYRTDGSLVDARQTGNTVRVVVRSAPRLDFPSRAEATDAQRLAANRRVVDRAGIEAWLPRYELTAGGRTVTGTVPCGRLSHPASYSGTALLSVLTFDISAAGGLGDGDAVTVTADGDTVYSNGDSLYVASDQRWRALPTDSSGRPKPVPQRTEIYKFDTSQPGPPRYVAGGAVDGWLINQYAMSEWDGHLRVATTVDGPDRRSPRPSSSTVYVLAPRGSGLATVGRVGGLGRGERIHAVRYAGGVGYVVTFRRTDPLYTLDLREPTRPRVVGELKITGYSAYLHPAGDGRLIGVGQEANAEGRTQGTQVSLFDVSDLARPTRLAQHHVRQGHSEAEFDPHAFLYWPAERLLVVPLTVYATGGSATLPTGSALLLRVTGSGLTTLGRVDHGASAGGETTIRRSLVVGGDLWTVSAAGLKATSLSSLAAVAWLPI